MNRKVFRSGKSNKFLDENRMKLLATHHTRYMGGVQVADHAVADMLRIINKLGLMENTVIFIISDHGENFYDHGRWTGHWHSLFEEEVQVPLVLYTPPELRIELPDQPFGVSLLDIAPSVLDITGIDEGMPMADGWSLLRTYPDFHRAKYLMLKTVKHDEFWSAICLEPYKLIIREHLEEGKKDTMLFDLSVDKHEKRNLYPEKKHLADSLAVYLQIQLDQTKQSLTEPTRTFTPQEIELLRALGYVN